MKTSAIMGEDSSSPEVTTKVVHLDQGMLKRQLNLGCTYEEIKKNFDIPQVCEFDESD